MLQQISVYIIIGFVVGYLLYLAIKRMTRKESVSTCADCDGCSLQAECKPQICPVEKAGGLDNNIRKWIQNPNKILKPYINPGMTVLDLGCGPGVFTLEIASLLAGSGKVIAADVQAGMLDKVRQKLQNKTIRQTITLHQCAPHSIQLTEPVDFILAFYVIHEVPNQNHLFSEIKAILKNNGSLLIIEPKFHVSKLAFDAMVEKLQQVGFKIVDKPHIRFSRTVLLRHKMEA